jgi:hypothetical protein
MAEIVATPIDQIAVKEDHPRARDQRVEDVGVGPAGERGRAQYDLVTCGLGAQVGGEKARLGLHIVVEQ